MKIYVVSFHDIEENSKDFEWYKHKPEAAFHAIRLITDFEGSFDVYYFEAEIDDAVIDEDFDFREHIKRRFRLL